MNKKISIFLPDLGGGGAERMMVNLANGLVERGWSVDLLVARQQVEYLSEVTSKVKLSILHSKNLFGALFPLMAHLKKNRPQTLIASMENAILIAVLAKLLSLSRVRIVARVANTLSQSLHGTKWYKRPIRKYGAYLCYRLANQIVANSEGAARDLSEVLKIRSDKIKVIYNPTVTPRMLEQAKAPVEHPWLKHKKKPVIMAVGRFNKQKNFSTLIKAFAWLNKKDHYNLIVLGKGEEREKLQCLSQKLGIANNIHMPGFVKNPYSYIARADLFVLASLWEGLPNVLIEALALGVPVVSSDCLSGPREILENGKYGELVPVGNHQALASAMARTLLHKPDTKEAAAVARTRFSVDRAVEEYLAIL